MQLDEHLARCRELNELCSQNGWIDNETLDYEVLERDGADWTLKVTFEEVVMEGSGCVASRVPCYGRVRVRMDDSGDVSELTVV